MDLIAATRAEGGLVLIQILFSFLNHNFVYQNFFNQKVFLQKRFESKEFYYNFVILRRGWVGEETMLLGKAPNQGVF